MKVFQINDCDWWIAPTLEAAIEDAKKTYGGASEYWELARELSQSELDEHFYRLETWECGCGQKLDESSPDWRFAGYAWEHCHGYPVGHAAAVNKRTFREELDRRIKAGAKTELFATTEH